ncbi:hypothetical protein RCL1_000399 [Eukaryota sp. TZLM3-RCL]
MVELDKNEPTNELNLTTRFALLLSKVFSKAKLSLIEPLVLHPKSFNVYLSNITQQYLILWFIRSLIISWKVENHWTIEIFDEILSNVNVENLDSRELIAVLRPLENISELFDFYCKFMSVKVTPLVIRDYAKTSEELSTSKQELTTKSQEFQTIERNLKAEVESLKKSKEEVEKKEELERKRCEQLEGERRSNKNTIINLQAEISKLKSIINKHADVIRRAEEEEERKRLEEERRRIEEEKRLEEERQRLMTAYRSNPVSFLVDNPGIFFNVCGGNVKFLRETLGSDLTLFNDLCVKSNTGNSSNRYVFINRPQTGKVVLIGSNITNTDIGLLDTSCRNGSCSSMNGFELRSYMFTVYVFLSIETCIILQLFHQ